VPLSANLYGTHNHGNVVSSNVMSWALVLTSFLTFMDECAGERVMPTEKGSSHRHHSVPSLCSKYATSFKKGRKTRSVSQRLALLKLKIWV